MKAATVSGGGYCNLREEKVMLSISGEFVL